MIYVLNSKGEPLMPTVRHGRVRHLLRDKKAFIVNYHPFTVQLAFAPHGVHGAGAPGEHGFLTANAGKQRRGKGRVIGERELRSKAVFAQRTAQPAVIALIELLVLHLELGDKGRDITEHKISFQ